jgi:hypothetical protein
MNIHVRIVQNRSPRYTRGADAVFTYEGDKVVLLLPRARFLLKCAQKNISPHLIHEKMNEIKNSYLFKQFSAYLELFY